MLSNYLAIVTASFQLTVYGVESFPRYISDAYRRGFKTLYETLTLADDAQGLADEYQELIDERR